MALLSDHDALAHWVRFHRKAHGLTQADLARRIGVSTPRISEIECGKGDPQIGTVSKIAKVLGVSTSTLLAPVDSDVLQEVA